MDRLLETVNVAITLLFLFLVLSMLATVVEEMVSSLWNSRGRVMRDLVVAMVGPDLAGLIYRHPLITGLVPAGIALPLPGWLRPILPFLAARLPAAIPKELFADVLMEIIDRRTGFQVHSVPDHIRSMMASVGQDRAAIRAKIIEWFKAGAEDHGNVVYKGNARSRLFVVGLLVAVSLNIDILTIGGYLWRTASPAQLEALSKAAATYQQGNPLDSNQQPDAARAELLKTLQGMALPMGWDDESPCAILRRITPDWPHLPQPLRTFAKKSCPDDYLKAQGPALPPDPKAPRTLQTVDSARVLGWLLTALAVSLGAQFWFNALGQVLGLKNRLSERK